MSFMTTFSGFRQKDFSTDVRGTYWRSRRALGGDLRNRLRRIYGRRYQTWGLPGSNTLHIARRSEYTFPPTTAQTVLFISAGPEFLRWGFSLPTTGSHWLKFRSSLREGVAMPLLLSLLHAHRLTFTDISDAFGGILGGCWRFQQGELVWREACSLPRPAVPHDIIYRLDDLPPDSESPLSLFVEADASTALAWERKTVDHLLPLLSDLIPLYEMCVSDA